MKELHAYLTRDHDGTFVTDFLDEPPLDEAPRDVVEIYGCVVGVYASDDIEWELLESVVTDAVAYHLGLNR